MASGLGAAFGLAAYATQQNGTPDLVGPRVTTAAADLGTALFTRYQDASSYITTEAKIVLSDWTKMTDVEKALPTAQWRLGDISTTTQHLELAAKQAIYQALVPVAYPILYDLGTGITDAKTWICRANAAALYDKNLFQHTDPGAQVTWTAANGQSHLIAVGARHTVSSLHSAYVPAPPESLTGPLFRDPNSPLGGIGLYKLQFYSPQNFHVFPQVLQQTRPTPESNNGYWKCQSMPDPPGNAAP